MINEKDYQLNNLLEAHQEQIEKLTRLGVGAGTDVDLSPLGAGWPRLVVRTENSVPQLDYQAQDEAAKSMWERR